LGLPAQSFTPRVPQFELVRQRAEEPRPDSPITYREFAYAVEPGRSRDEIEALLRDRYQATLATISDRPPGKFVQLAVFDHVFKRRPERPPLATFAWKDWRGEPVLAFPGFGEEAMGPMSRVPPAPQSVPPPGDITASVPPVAASSLPAMPLPPASSPASFPPTASAPTPSIPPESARVVPMAPVVISSPPPAPKATIVEVAPAPPAEVEIPIEDAAPVPADVEITIEDAAPVRPADVEITIEDAAPVPLVETATQIVAPASAPVDVEISIEEAAPAPAFDVPVSLVEGSRAPLVEATIAEASAAPAVEVPISVVEGSRVPAVEVPISVVEGSRAPAVEVPTSLVAGAATPGFELSFEAPPSPVAPAAANSGGAERGSRPRIANEGRRRAGEDLIGELFEIMHELHFARDVAEGSQFVLSVLDELLPCEGVLIHVFDINTSHFVVVRAKGPQSNTVILQRMSDQDPLVRSVMRSSHALSVKNAADDARFKGARWQALGVVPRAALCGGVQLSGRYLGLIEVANPHGDIPFHQSELNALDYICEQFAAFLSKKPIVLSADVVLSHV
jgi:hypothetical protein